MSLLISLFPLYLAGNLHCFGMCGPLVMMISQHRFRYFYFLGRLFSFSLAASLAGGLGFVLSIALNEWRLSASLSLVGGAVLIFLGMNQLGRFSFRLKGLELTMERAHRSLIYLILKDTPFALFLFGFFTILLPCGQSLIVLAACALTESPISGFINGLLFSLLTTPSLFLALHLHRFIKKGISEKIVGWTALLAGILALLRGFAELDILPHGVIHAGYHIVLW